VPDLFSQFDKEFGFTQEIEEPDMFSQFDKEFGFTETPITPAVQTELPLTPEIAPPTTTGVELPEPIESVTKKPEDIFAGAGIEEVPEEKYPLQTFPKEAEAFGRGIVSRVPETAVTLFTFPVRVISGAGAALQDVIETGDPTAAVEGFKQGYRGERDIFGKSAQWWDEMAAETKEIIRGKPSIKEEEYQHILADQVITALWITYGGVQAAKALPGLQNSAKNIINKTKNSLKKFRELELGADDLKMVRAAHQGYGGKTVADLTPKQKEFFNAILEETGGVKSHALKTGTFTTDELIYPWQKITPKDIIKAKPPKVPIKLEMPKAEVPAIVPKEKPIITKKPVVPEVTPKVPVVATKPRLPENVLNRRIAIKERFPEVKDPKRIEELEEFVSDRILGDYNVTKFKEIDKVRNYVEDNDIPYSVIRGDGRELKAWNKKNKNIHAETDKEIKKIWGEVYATEIKKAGSIIGRDQGDEFLGIMPNYTVEETENLLNEIEKKADVKIKEMGLSELPSAKGELNELPVGTGYIDFGVSEGIKGKFGEADRIADKMVNLKKDEIIIDKAKQYGYNEILDDKGEIIGYVRKEKKQEIRPTEKPKPEIEKAPARPEPKGIPEGKRPPEKVTEVKPPPKVTPTKPPAPTLGYPAKIIKPLKGQDIYKRPNFTKEFEALAKPEKHKAITAEKKLIDTEIAKRKDINKSYNELSILKNRLTRYQKGLGVGAEIKGKREVAQYERYYTSGVADIEGVKETHSEVVRFLNKFDKKTITDINEHLRGKKYSPAVLLRAKQDIIKGEKGIPVATTIRREIGEWLRGEVTPTQQIEAVKKEKVSEYPPDWDIVEVQEAQLKEEPAVFFSQVEDVSKKQPTKKTPEEIVKPVVTAGGKPEATKNQTLTEANAQDDVKFLTAFENVYSKIKDSSVSIRKIQKVFEKEKGIKATPKENIEFKIDRVRGSGGIAKQFIADNLEPIFQDIRKGRKLAEAGAISRGLEDYLIAKRQKWLYQNKPKYEDVGYSKEWANAIVNKVETAKTKTNELIQQKAKEIWNYGQLLKGIKKEFGIIDEEFEKMLKEPFYVPFYRDVEARLMPSTGREKFTAMTRGIKRIKGSKSGRNIRNIYQNLITATNETIVNAARNDVFRTVIDYSKRSKELEKVITKLPPRWRKAGTIEHRTEVDKILAPELDKIIKDLEATKKVKIRTSKYLGKYKTENKEVMTMFGATESTKGHEIGHLIDEDIMSLQKLVRMYPKAFNKIAEMRYEGGETELGFINYVKKPEEKAAEFVSMYITDRARLNEIAPNAIRDFEAMIRKHEILKKLIDIRPSRAKGIDKITEDNWIMDTSIPRDEDVISGFIEGKMEHYRVPKELAIAVKNLHPEQIPTLLRVLTIPTSILRRSAVSLNIDFFIPNMVRDQIDASFNAKNIPFYDFLRGFKHYISNDEISKQYQRMGGAMDSPEAGVEQLSKSANELVYGSRGGQFLDPHYWQSTGLLKKTFDLIKYIGALPFRGISGLAEASEMSSRLGVFERGLKSGDDIRTSVHAARQASLDFQRFGTHGRVPNQIIPFINAAMEGVDRMARSAYEHPKRFAMAAFTYAIAPTIGLTIWNIKNKEYKNISDREKQNNYIIMNPVGSGYWKIPKGHIVKLIVNPFQLAWERTLGTSEGDWTDVASSVFSAASPVDNLGTVVPTALKLLVEPIANYDFYWKKVIESETVRAIGKPGERYKKSTSETLKSIGKALNISPIMMQHEINSLFSGLGRHTILSIDWILGKTGIQEMPEITENRIPILRRFRGKAEDWKSETEKHIREIERAVFRINKLSVKSLVKYNKYSWSQAIKVKIQNRKMKIELLKKKLELQRALGKESELLKTIDEIMKEVKR